MLATRGDRALLCQSQTHCAQAASSAELDVVSPPGRFDPADPAKLGFSKPCGKVVTGANGDDATAGGNGSRRSLKLKQAPVAAWRAVKKPVALTSPIQLVGLPAPKQLQLKTRGAGVGEAAASVGTATSEGTPSACPGAGSRAGPLGAGSGATNGFGGGSCATARSPGVPSSVARNNTRNTAIKTLANCIFGNSPAPGHSVEDRRSLWL
jgi:hypothetical protein